jgi:helicase SWR1
VNPLVNGRKTIQTIALIAHLATEKHVWGPHLVVVPTSVILNWEMEFKKWAPGFKILTYYGDAKQREQKRKGWNKQDTWHVCITSYQLVIHDQQIFRRKRWEYMILDEAHNIKNFRSQRWQTLLNFNANHRLLLTGTPLQNNLIELWSLLYFLMPQGVSNAMPAGFANLKEFQEWFANPVDKIIQTGAHIVNDEARNTVAKLHGVLRPYILRRLKQDVEKQMPAKYEHILYCRLSKRQRYLYDDFMSRAQTRETLASGNFMSIISCLMQLRKVCNHPDLFETRPIVTSFAMPRSCVTDYEKTESFIRSTFLIQGPFDTVDLHALNLQFTQNEDMSKQCADHALQLSASPTIAKACDELEEAVETVVLPDFTTLKAHSAYKDYQNKLSKLDRLEHVGYLSDLRCKKRPVYGSEIFRICERIEKPDPNRVPPQPLRTSDDYLDSSDVIASMVMDVQRRFQAITPSVDKFAVITPAVVALDLPQLIFSKLGPEELKEVKTTYSDISFPARTRLSIAFPDKRLLQYDCGKLQRLDGLLRELISGGHRALIFTQMTRVLDILEIFLNFHGYRYLRLDGATKIEQRQIMTERFNSDTKISVFILSSRSGGLGINLTGADSVIFYDSDWNPCMDKQCQDRCHRIGQTRDVHIYRFVSEFTIEENIFRKANQKRMLDNVVITEGNFTSDFFNKVDWRDMLGEDMGVPDIIPEHTAGDLGHGKKVELAFAAAEDSEDAVAARRAQKEMEYDAVEFAENPTPGTPATPVTPATPAGVASSTPAPVASASEREVSTSTPDVVAQTPSIIEMDATEEEEEPGSIDDWMIMFIERERLDLDEVK